MQWIMLNLIFLCKHLLFVSLIIIIMKPQRFHIGLDFNILEIGKMNIDHLYSDSVYSYGWVNCYFRPHSGSWLFFVRMNRTYNPLKSVKCSLRQFSALSIIINLCIFSRKVRVYPVTNAVLNRYDAQTMSFVINDRVQWNHNYYCIISRY